MAFLARIWKLNYSMRGLSRSGLTARLCEPFRLRQGSIASHFLTPWQPHLKTTPFSQLTLHRNRAPMCLRDHQRDREPQTRTRSAPPTAPCCAVRAVPPLTNVWQILRANPWTRVTDADLCPFSLLLSLVLFS